jgi:branched-chain amino acid transport system substrate-binding protein
MLGLVAACSDSDDAATSTTVETTVAPTTTMKPDDGVLRLGALLPLSGPGAEIGRSMSDAVEMAVEEINAAGGVGGPVDLVIEDEGDGPVTAARGLEALIAAEVDAIVGPGSSLVALDVLLTLRREQILACSPSATALALDDFPDDGLFFRSAPSDSVQAGAIARAIDLTGRSSVSVLYVDDAYGQPLTNSLQAELDEQSISLDELVPFSAGDPDYADEVEQALDSGAQVIAVIGDPTFGPRVVSTILQAGGDETIPVIVNDAMRGAPLTNMVGELSGAALERVRGVGLRVAGDSTEFSAEFRERFPDDNGFFAVNAFECVDLIVLSARAASSTSSPVIADAMTSVANGGQPCASFADCDAALAEGRNIDYEGPSGVLRLSVDGEVTRGTYDLFGLDELGRERPLGLVIVGGDEPQAN